MASYSKLASMLKKNNIAENYIHLAKEMAEVNSRYRQVFDQPGIWSQKYNLVWDGILNLGMFSNDIIDKEVAGYLARQNEYGLPLFDGDTYTKSDWVIWTATMARDPETFHQLIEPVYKFYNETIDRVPMTDWYWTDYPHQRGLKAHPATGGIFIKLLSEQLVATNK